jgi:hypothetical protein
MRALGRIAILLLACALAVGLVLGQETDLSAPHEMSFFNQTEDSMELSSGLQVVTIPESPERPLESVQEAQVQTEEPKEEELDVSDQADFPLPSDNTIEEPLADNIVEEAESIPESAEMVDEETVEQPEPEEVEIPEIEVPQHVVPIVEADPVVEDQLKPIEASVEPQREVAPYPIQLIYPSEDHELLLVNQTSLAWLASFEKPVAIVAVCGPLHSGKSFLMNQLLGRTSGFALGPTTEPKTRGLWMWNHPIEFDDHVIVFLDTEGLFASNISEAYDAKIFAISSLLSSYLIYNSVKFIDQSAIDYIELLARRAQLFGIKAEIATSNEDSFVSAPKLLWVVQDFVQEMERGETPQEWLINLLSSRKKSESTASSLPQLFEDIDCFTLFLPEYRRERLRHLDTVHEDELLPEYRADMAILRDKVIKNAKVKTRGKFANLTGLGASALLQTLVTAANQGSFPEVPSIWKSFLKVQTQQAILDAVGFYDSAIEAQCERQGPFNAKELAEMHSQVLNDTKSLFSRLTFGFKDLERDNIEELLSKVSRLYSGVETSNTANLSRLCQDTYKSVREGFKVALWRLELPIKKADLQTKLQVLQEQQVVKYKGSLPRYHEEESFKNYLAELKNGMRGESAAVELKNSGLLQEVIVNATGYSLARCVHHLSLQDKDEIGLGAQMLKQHKEEAANVALSNFNKLAGFALEDLPTAPAARKALDTEIQAILTRFDVQNAERIDRRAQKIASQLGKEMSRAFDEIRLPQTRSIIESKVEVIKHEFLQKFDSSLSDVVGMDPTKSARQKLISLATSDLQELYRRNNVKYDRIISDALPSLKSNIAPILSTYWWPPAAEEFARRAVNATLQGVELIENENLVAELADRFIDANLADEILSIWKKLALVAGCGLFLIVAAFIGLCCRRK